MTKREFFVATFPALCAAAMTLTGKRPETWEWDSAAELMRVNGNDLAV